MFFVVLGEILKWSLIFFNQNPPKKLKKTHTKLTRKIKHKNKHYKKQINFFYSLGKILKWGLFFLIKTHKKKLTKTHTKLTRKIKHKNKHYKKQINFFFYESLLIDTPISNNTHQKNCQKTHKNPHTFLSIRIFVFMG
jgi:hypothetical protein